MAAMSLPEKAGQLIMPAIGEDAESLIADCHIGGFVFMGNGQRSADILTRGNSLQAASPRPLWFSMDSEAGIGARVADATIFPLNMAFGAANNPAHTEFCGRVTARESRALGLQIAFGPTVDVNTEPRNPIISTRSYGDDPAQVTRLAQAFLAGARAEGVLSTLKHFPGHGASAGDSHNVLPEINITRAEMETQHPEPYRVLARVAPLVMTAHLWFSQFSPATRWPATLSAEFNIEYLRRQFGFEGVLVSDAYDMKGLVLAAPTDEERAIMGLIAGLDLILDPTDARAVHRGIIDGVATGRIPLARLEAALRRVLSAKSRAGLPQQRFADPAAAEALLNHPKQRDAIEAICADAFTQLRGTTRPALTPQDRVLLGILEPRQRIFYRFGLDPFIAELSASGAAIEVVELPHENTLAAAENLFTSKGHYCLIAGSDWHSISSPSQAALFRELASRNIRHDYVAFGAPYHLLDVPGAERAWCGYSTLPAMQQVGGRTIAQGLKARGTCPVRLAIP